MYVLLILYRNIDEGLAQQAYAPLANPDLACGPLFLEAFSLLQKISHYVLFLSTAFRGALNKETRKAFSYLFGNSGKKKHKKEFILFVCAPFHIYISAC